MCCFDGSATVYYDLCLCIVGTVTIDQLDQRSPFFLFFRKYKKKKKWLQICASRRFDRLQSALISIDVSPPPPPPCWIYSRGNIEKNERAVGIRVHRVNHANLITLHTCLYYLFYLFREKFFAKHDPPFQQLRAISRAIIILPFRLVTGYMYSSF